MMKSMVTMFMTVIIFGAGSAYALCPSGMGGACDLACTSYGQGSGSVHSSSSDGADPTICNCSDGQQMVIEYYYS